ncbi:hypothetical protein HYV73_03985 [Candidatus Uhrbacteria bacterium]|nr:hypothetical protein [Candidatus Uhrbacteria bacterium]
MYEEYYPKLYAYILAQTMDMVAGFDEPTLLQTVWINILFVLTQMIRLLSITFWLVIPVGIWLLCRSKKYKRFVHWISKKNPTDRSDFSFRSINTAVAGGIHA